VLKSILAASAASVILSIAAPSLANGRFPAANQLVFAPNDPNFIVLRTTFAVLPSTDNGTTWRYVCEGVLGLPTDQGEDPSIGLMADGSLLAGVPGYVGGGLGLSVSPDRGCNWSCIGGGLTGQSVIDVAVRPDTPASAVALTGTIVPSDSAFSNTYSQVFETTDNGKTWTAIGMPIDPTVLVTTIDVTKTDPNRIYVSGTRAYGSSRTASLFISRDRGATWTEAPIPMFDPNSEQSIYIAAIDPTNADNVYLRSNGNLLGGQSRIYFTRNGGADGGASFSMTASLPDEGGFDVEEASSNDIAGELLGFALSPDGSKAYAGTVESGLWIASTSDMQFTQKNANVRIKCLQTRNSELWACSDITSGFVLGESLDDGATFTPKIHYVTSLCGSVECQPNPGGPLGCGAMANASSCQDAYQAYCMATDVTNSCGTCPAGDAGAPTADAGGSSNSGNAGSSSSSGCSTVGGRGATGFAAVLSLVGLALVRRRGKGR
jgi:uncharacterized protein (TIGR03382 family)